MIQNRYWIHWWIAMGCLLITAICCAIMQNMLSYDRIGELVFVFILLIGALFSWLFAWLQIETKNTYITTIIWVAGLGYYLIFLSYFYHNLPRGQGVEFSLFQKIIHSYLSFWCGFLLPFIGSILTYIWRSKAK